MAVPDATFLHSATRAPRSSRGKAYLAAAVLVLCGVAAYSNSLHAPFVFDDRVSIIENPSIRDLWSSLFPVENETGANIGRPVVNFTFAVNYTVGGLNPSGYHLFNLFIHICSSWILFGIVRRTLLGPTLRTKLGPDALLIALSVSALWTVHPLLTESVTCVVQRNETLMAFFYYLALYCFIRSQESAVSGGWQIGAVLSCLLGMATKEVMVTAPIVILLYDRTFVAGSFHDAWQRRRPFYGGLAATWILLAALVLAAHQRGGTAGFSLGISPWAYLSTQCYAILIYGRLALFPAPLILDYGADLQTNPLVVGTGMILLVCTLPVIVWLLYRKSAIGFLGAWFFIILTPSSSVLPLTTQTIAEHRMYLPLAAVLVLIVITARIVAAKRWSVLCMLLASAFALLTYKRNSDYETSERILRDTTAKLPSSFRAEQNLGVELARDGRLAESVAVFTAVLRTAPGDAITENNLGNALLLLNRPGEALTHYQKAASLNPDFAEARNNFGALLSRFGRSQEAVAEFQAVLRLQPDSTEAQINLANAYNFSGRPSQGLAIYEILLRRNPQSAPVQYGRGNAFFLLTRYDEAVQAYATAVKLQPDAPEYHVSLGNALLMLNRDAEAISAFQEALRLDPGSPTARAGLDTALARRSQNPNPVLSP